MCLQRWILAHFRHIVPRHKYEDYEWENPYVGRWKPLRGLLMLDTSEA